MGEVGLGEGEGGQEQVGDEGRAAHLGDSCGDLTVEAVKALGKGAHPGEERRSRGGHPGMGQVGP